MELLKKTKILRGILNAEVQIQKAVVQKVEEMKEYMEDNTRIGDIAIHYILPKRN
jgi:hypothetical protein